MVVTYSYNQTDWAMYTTELYCLNIALFLLLLGPPSVESLKTESTHNPESKIKLLVIYYLKIKSNSKKLSSLKKNLP